MTRGSWFGWYLSPHGQEEIKTSQQQVPLGCHFSPCVYPCCLHLPCGSPNPQAANIEAVRLI